MRCIVVGADGNGSPDCEEVVVYVTQKEYDDGAHYLLAREQSSFDYTYCVADENDPLGKKWLSREPRGFAGWVEKAKL
jgi:hypothetical protein